MHARAEMMEESRSERLTQWAGVLTGPVLWFCDQQVNLLLVNWACSTGNLVVLHVASGFFLLLTILAGLMAWRHWRMLQRNQRASFEGEFPRPLFMAGIGIFASAFFALVILAQAIPVFIIDPCQR